MIGSRSDLQVIKSSLFFPISFQPDDKAHALRIYVDRAGLPVHERMVLSSLLSYISRP